MILIKPNILDRWEIYHGDCSSYYHRRDPARMKQTDFPFRASQGPGFLSLRMLLHSRKAVAASEVAASTYNKFHLWRGSQPPRLATR